MIAAALAAGRPVVALKASGVENAVVDGYNGYLVDNQPEFCAKIKLLYTDNLLYNNMQNNAYETSLKYDPIALKRKLWTYYK